MRAAAAMAAEALGLVAIVLGAWLIWPPAALILGGLAAVVLAQGIERLH